MGEQDHDISYSSDKEQSSRIGRSLRVNTMLTRTKNNNVSKQAIRCVQNTLSVYKGIPCDSKEISVY